MTSMNDEAMLETVKKAYSHLEAAKRTMLNYAELSQAMGYLQMVMVDLNERIYPEAEDADGYNSREMRAAGAKLRLYRDNYVPDND